MTDMTVTDDKGKMAWYIQHTGGEEKAIITIPEGYKKFLCKLIDAFIFTAYGKGAQRHGGRGGFDDQPIIYIQRMLESPDGPLFQAIKKCQEAARFHKKGEHERAEYELLGAI